MEVITYTVVERLDDGRLLVEPSGRPGVLVVVGESTRAPAAARMGYGRTRTPIVRGGVPRPVDVTRRVRAAQDEVEQHREIERQLREAAAAPERRARELFLSLLDPQQRAQWDLYGRCWVPTPRGPVRLGVRHDLRFRPVDRPGEEWSLCVVPQGPRLPRSDEWTNLLLFLAADPEEFFRVANVQGTGRRLTRPHPP